MIDPYTIPRARMFPLPRPCLLTTRDWGRSAPVHCHRTNVDAEGNGATDIVADHFHRVLSHRIMPSPVDSHEHKFTDIPCGGGAGRGWYRGGW